MYLNNWKRKDASGSCVTILLKNTVFYLVVIVKLQNDECLILVFTDKVQNFTPSIGCPIFLLRFGPGPLPLYFPTVYYLFKVSRL